MMLRPGWVFGDDSWYELFFNQVIKKFNYVPQYGEGQNCMSIIHVEDLGRMIKEYALRASYTRDYNLIGPINIPHYEFVKLLSKIHNKAIRSFSKEDVIRKFGQVIYDALSSDIHLATNYIDIVETFEYDYKRVDDLFN